MSEGSWVGLDVHARSVVAGVIDQGSGEVRSLRVPAGSDATVAWLQTLSAPVRVVYEAGPTGYRLARACAEAGVSCVVAAPSKIRPAADRVKTDRRDAERLARLLRLGEITAVRVPGPEEEAARDLVRAREDARGDLMRARHRLSKLLLRHGRCTRRPRGRGPTMRGFAGIDSEAARSRSSSTNATAACSTRRPGETHSIRRSRSWPRASRTPMSSSGSSACAASRR
jgi:transposase